MRSYDVVACKKCGLVFADNIPSQAEFNNYYEILSKYEFNYKEGLVNQDYIKHFSKITGFIIRHLKNKEAVILDIGCSTGGLLSILKSKGYTNLLGIDPSPSCVKTVNKLYRINASVNNIENFKTNKKFDLIILSAVLEHVVDFRNSFEKIRSLLNENGLLFIEVPDIEKFWQYVSAPFQQFSIEHINYFSKYSLANLLSLFSFRTIKVKDNVSKLSQMIDPDIFILAQKTNNNDSGLVKDKVSASGIKKYIKKCLKTDLRIKKIVNEKLPKQNKIIVWGVGTHTQRLIGAGILDPVRIIYFVDSNKRYTGKKLYSLTIKSPGDITEKNPILISTQSYQDEITNQIRKTLHLDNEIITLY